MKKIFRSIGNFFSNLFANARKYVRPAVLIVEVLKTIAESSAAEIVVRMTKSNIDNVLLARARQILPGILHLLQITRDCDVAGRTNEEIIACGLDKLRLYHPDAQKSFWTAIAAHLAHDFADGKFTLGEMIGTAWFIYNTEVRATPLAVAA